MKCQTSSVLRFQLFGFGLRRKFVYRAGTLCDALSGEVLYKWNVRMEQFFPSEYRVDLEIDGGKIISILEDSEALWLQREGSRAVLTRHPVALPTFAGPHAALLRVLHAELLVNVMPWGPVPNLWVYPRPWYRDAAMMALCFEKTGNIDQIAPWIDDLLHPYDFNNRGNAEPDNLGQVLMLASFTRGEKHPVVERALNEVKKVTCDRALVGLTDFAPHPVYQTKWLKYGLKRLGLEDHYEIPAVPDAYSSLFWMDFKDQHKPHPRFGSDALAKWPYLNWAEAHFYGEAPPEPVSPEQFPLTRELQASEVNYGRMGIVSREWVDARQCSPHTWHAAEMFLYFLNQD